MVRSLRSSPQAAELYLSLLKHSLTRTLSPERVQYLQPKTASMARLYRISQALLGRRGILVMRRADAVNDNRQFGRDWPVEAETMIGLARLDNIQSCIEAVLDDDVPGDLIETGVWRGGAVIFMRGVLKAYGDTGRRVWAADSYEGLPPPDPKNFPADAGDLHHTKTELRCSLDEVRSNFVRYDLLDDQVRFLVGWFKDTLPDAPISQLALIRLDGDMYESTMQALRNLYPKLSPGGFVIVDDYGAVAACKQAVIDFRREFDITAPVRDIDGIGVYWRTDHPGPETSGTAT